VPPDAKFDGSIIYAKAGNIWIQTADGAKQVTISNHDSMPSWSPDGSGSTSSARGARRAAGSTTACPNTYALEIPRSCAPMPTAAARRQLKDGGIKQGNLEVRLLLRQPVISPDGSTVAGDVRRPEPDNKHVVLQFLDTAPASCERRTCPPTERARPPGSRLAAGREVPALRPERPRRARAGRR
jgi:hypothetical protein